MISQKGKEDLSMFANSAVSFYDPGDTAPDSVIFLSFLLLENSCNI